MPETLANPAPHRRRWPRTFWWSAGCVLLSFATNETIQKFGSQWPGWIIVFLWILPLIPFGIWGIRHEWMIKHREQMRERFGRHPISYSLCALMFVYVGAQAAVHIFLANHRRPTQTQNRAQQQPTQQGPPKHSSIPSVSGENGGMTSPPPTPRITRHTTPLHAYVHGSDNTVVGNDHRNIQGNGNTIVGPTDAHGNTIITRGGTAIGNGATADQSSIAIGAHANAGQQIGTVNCADNIGNCAGINKGQQITNQYGPPLLALSEDQARAIHDAMIQYSGQSISFEWNYDNDNCKKFTAELVPVLQGAGLNVTGVALTFRYDSAPPGISVRIGANRAKTAETLVRTLASVGLVKLPIWNQPADKPDDLVIVINPSQ